MIGILCWWLSILASLICYSTILTTLLLDAMATRVIDETGINGTEHRVINAVEVLAPKITEPRFKTQSCWVLATHCRQSDVWNNGGDYKAEHIDGHLYHISKGNIEC